MKKLISRLSKIAAPRSLWVGALVFAFLVDPALATEADSANGAILALAQIMAVIIHILTFLVLLIMSWGGDLIGTTFLTGPEAMEAIRPMWVFIRNLVNISFVLVLMFLAFANLFSSLSGGQGNWTIKDKLPRVIIALIAVNFSLLIFRVAIDAVHVGTMTILSITDTVMDEKAAYNPAAILNSGIDTTSYESCDQLDADYKTATPSQGGGKCLPFYRYVEYALCPSKDTGNSDCLIAFTDEVENQTLAVASSSTEQNIFWAFGTYFQKLELLPILAGKLNSLVGVVNSTLFSAILAILYAVSWVAIFIALAIRILMLWFFMIMSPALVAAQIMGVGSGGSVGDFNIQQSLVTNLIMPLKIATAFALSFVMIATMIEVSPENATTIFEPGRALQPFWGVTTSSFGIMWQIMTIIVFWKAVWWALDGSEAQVITDKIKDGTKTAGKITGKMALDKAAAPVPYLNPRVLSRIPQRLNTALDSNVNKELEGAMKGINGAFGVAPIDRPENTDKLISTFQGVGYGTNQALHEEFDRMGFTLKDIGGLRDEGEFKAAFGHLNKDMQNGLRSVWEPARKGKLDEADINYRNFMKSGRFLQKESATSADTASSSAIKISAGGRVDGEIKFNSEAEGRFSITTVDELTKLYNTTTDEALRDAIEAKRPGIEAELRHKDASGTQQLADDKMLHFEVSEDGKTRTLSVTEKVEAPASE